MVLQRLGDPKKNVARNVATRLPPALHVTDNCRLQPGNQLVFFFLTWSSMGLQFFLVSGPDVGPISRAERGTSLALHGKPPRSDGFSIAMLDDQRAP